MKKRMALQAVDLTLAFPVIERLNQIEPTMPAEVRPDAAGLLREGQQMASIMLASAHGEDVPGYALPSLSEMNQWRHAANLAAGAVNIADPNFIHSYLSRLPADQQRLVRSMVSWAQAKTGTR